MPESEFSAKCILPDRPFNLTLNDCLACSGCMTPDSAAVKPTDLAFLEKPGEPTSFIISPQSKVNIYNALGLPPLPYSTYEELLSVFLRSKFGVARIIDTSSLRPGIYRSIASEYSSTEHLIISGCPATVMYIEKTAPHLIGCLSKTLSPQQIACLMARGSRCISIMPCYDKRLENGRDGAHMDHALTTAEFYKVIVDLGFREFIERKSGEAHEIGEDERTQWNIGSSSGGYVEAISRSIGSCEVRRVKGGVTEYIVEDGGKSAVLAQITGLENAMNYFNSSKRSGPMYKMAEIFICPGSCIAGPGQIPGVASAGTYSEVGRSCPERAAEVGGKRSFKSVEIRKIDFAVSW
jgi:iron only hydrogenase large subunit-like protein